MEPTIIIANISTERKFAYNKGEMSFTVTVNIDSEEQMDSMLDILEMCKLDIQQTKLDRQFTTLTKELGSEIIKHNEERSESPSTVESVPAGE